MDKNKNNIHALRQVLYAAATIVLTFVLPFAGLLVFTGGRLTESDTVNDFSVGGALLILILSAVFASKLEDASVYYIAVGGMLIMELFFTFVIGVPRIGLYHLIYFVVGSWLGREIRRYRISENDNKSDL